MTLLTLPLLRRRRFLQAVGGLAVGAFGGLSLRGDELPPNTNPHAIFGDDVEPNWETRVTITVGREKADLVVIDSGGDKGIGIEINGETESVVLANNEMRETRGAASRTGLLIAAETRDIHYENNRIEGFATPVPDLRRK